MLASWHVATGERGTRKTHTWLMHSAVTLFPVSFSASLRISWVTCGGGTFVFDGFPWRKETLPGAQREASISRRFCAGDQGSVRVMFLNAMSIIVPQPQVLRTEGVVTSENLKAGFSRKNEHYMKNALYARVDCLHQPADCCAFTGGCILSSLGKSGAQCTKKKDRGLRNLEKNFLGVG